MIQKVIYLIITKIIKVIFYVNINIKKVQDCFSNQKE